LFGTLLGACTTAAMYTLTGEFFPWIIFFAMGMLLGYVIMIKKIYSVAVEHQIQRANSALKSEIDLLPIIGILRRMGSISDSDLDKVFYNGVTSGDHLLEMLVQQKSLTEDDIKKAHELYEKIKKGNSKAVEAMFDAVNHHAAKRMERINRMTVITDQASLKLLGEG
jgi:hypothetical protein